MRLPTNLRQTLGTRSDFSISLPTGESETNESELSIADSNEEIDELNTSDEDDQRSMTTTASSESVHSSDTSVDFSSFKPLSEISEHSIVPLRNEDIQWACAKPALKIRPHRVKPKLSWYRCYHQWAVRQRPEPYKVTLNHADKLINVAEEDDDCDRGIFNAAMEQNRMGQWEEEREGRPVLIGKKCGMFFRVMTSLSYRTSIGLNPQHEQHQCIAFRKHAEAPSRIESIVEHLKRCGVWDRCDIIKEHIPVDEGDLRETHAQSYVHLIAELKEKSQEMIDEFASQFDSIYLCQVFVGCFDRHDSC
ncbi:unnamed protein product [Toxocara canis]|uniref:Histone deacetylase n=1 Tax=Toxocara canis TaxID=6265 RepID=A0A183USG5_TOXCA|nr:unnamed protein product [Toxocara canis]